MPDATRDLGYDEFAMLADNADEVELPFDPASPPAVRREWVEVPSGHELSALVWGDAPPELVFLHGGAQNAHTWDTMALALGRPMVAIDLPGHGHSAWRDDKDYRPQTMAVDVAAAIEALAPTASTLVGMSLGGLTAMVVMALEPAAFTGLALVDITPGVNRDKAAAIVAFVGGPEEFASFDEILDRTIAFNPTRSRSSLERGVRHNAKARPDGTWTWRYDRPTDARMGELDGRFADLWDAVASVPHPVLLLRGGTSPVVDDADVEELRRRHADAEIVVVADAGHSIQGDQPIELARLLAAFADR